MSGNTSVGLRAGERGAVTIKTILTLFMAASAAFVLLKIVPVYVEQRQVIYDVDELARTAVVRNYTSERVNQDIERIIGEHDLPEESISFVQRGKGAGVQIKVGYTRPIDLLLTTYGWRVDYSVTGKEL